MSNTSYTNADQIKRYSYSTKAGTDEDPDLSPEDIVDALADVATEAKQDTQITHLAAIEAAVGTLDSSTLPTGAATATNQTAQNTLIGAVTETAPASDTASSGLNGRLQRIAQNITSLLGRLPSALSNGFFQVSVKETITLPVSGTFYQATQPVSDAGGSLTVDGTVAVTGVATETTLAALNTKTPALGQALAAAAVPVVLTAIQQTALTPPAAITGFATETTLAAQSAKLPAALGQGTMAQSLSIVLSSDHSDLTIKAKRSTTPTQNSIASSATNVTLFASNANRLGATIYNDSTAILYMKLGAAASNTSYTIQLAANGGYYEVPFGYTGIIDGIWSAANGSARVTELT